MNQFNLFHFEPAGFPLFRQFLIVRISERIQDISSAQCAGCQRNDRFGSLHPCQRLSLTTRMDMFLPQVVTEVLEKMYQLLQLFHHQFTFNTSEYMELADQFVHQLDTKQVYDRRYVNEDTASMFEYDNSWLTTLDLQDVCDELLAACEEIDEEEKVLPLKKKRKIDGDVPPGKRSKK